MLKTKQETRAFVPKKNSEDVYALPVELMNQADENFPSFRACGLDWSFVLLEEEGSWETARHDMFKDRHMSIGEMTAAVKENVSRHLSDIAFTVLFGRASDITTLPFVKAHFTNDNGCPPFGVSLMLCDEAVSMLHQCIGDFYAVPADVSAFYAISAGELEKHGLDPMKSFTKMISSHGEEPATIFNHMMAFYGTKGSNDSSCMKHEPAVAWQNVYAEKS